MESVAIETTELSKKYPSGVLAVDRLNLQVRRGEVFGFLGPNGAGKTTSIKMMVGLLKPTSGQVLVEGERAEAASKRIKKMIGVCPQDIVVWKRHFTIMRQRTAKQTWWIPPRKKNLTWAENSAFPD